MKFEDYLKTISNGGFKYIELWTDKKNLWPLTTGKKEILNAKETIENYGLEISSTLPIPFSESGYAHVSDNEIRYGRFDFEFNLINPDEKGRQKAVRFYMASMDLTSSLGVDMMLLVPGYIEQPNFMESKISFRRYWERLITSLKECAKYAEDKGVYLGIENAVIANIGDKPHDLKKMVDDVGSENLKVYLDVANANVFFPPTYYIQILKDSLLNCIHITDNDGSFPFHLPFGRGTMDIKGIIRELRGIGWDGYLIPEVFYPEDPMKALALCRDYLLKII